MKWSHLIKQPTGPCAAAGLLMAIIGAMGMGCAGFFAEQHALISYNIVPGEPSLYFAVKPSLWRFDSFQGVLHTLITGPPTCSA